MSRRGAEGGVLELVLAHRVGSEGVDLATVGRLGREAGLEVRAVRLSSLEQFPVPSVVHLASEHFVAVRERRGDFYEVVDPGSGEIRWLIARELAADATGVLLVARQSQTEGVGNMQDLADAEASRFRGRYVSWGQLDLLGPGDGEQCPGRPGRSVAEGSAATGTSSCRSCRSVGMPIWQVDEPTLNLRIDDTPLVYQPKYGPVLELSLTFHSRRRFMGGTDFLPQGRFEVGPSGSRYMLASSWMSWVEYETSPGWQAHVCHPGGAIHRYTFDTGVNLSDQEYWSHSQLEKVYSGGTFIGFRLLWLRGNAGPSVRPCQ